MGELFQPMHLLIIGGIVVLLFGGRKLPELGKGLGEGYKSFKDGLKGANDEPAATAPVTKPGDTGHVITPKAEVPVSAVKTTETTTVL